MQPRRRAIRQPSRAAARLVFAVLLAVAVSWVAPLPADAQDTEPPAQPEPEDRVESIDEILAAEEAMFSGAGYIYDAGERRDPFRSLLAARTQLRPAGPRPEGIPGLLIDDIDLTGVFVTGEGPVAQILSADKNESFLLRTGDQLFDGDVVRIGEDEIVFRQIVDDPTAVKPFREVVKRLSP